VDVEHGDEVDGTAALECAGDPPKKWFKRSGGRGDVISVRATVSKDTVVRTVFFGYPRWTTRGLRPRTPAVLPTGCRVATAANVPEG
jgi:hypothetical protein